MIQVRRNVFETNSSSTHSIALTQEGVSFYTQKEMEDSLIKAGAMIITPDPDWEDRRELNLASIPEKEWEFGWGPAVVDDFAHKLLYALLSFSEDKIITSGIQNFLKEKFKLEHIIFPAEFGDYHDIIGTRGYIDHDSTMVLGQLLHTHDEQGYTMEEFLTRRDIVVLLDSEG